MATVEHVVERKNLMAKEVDNIIYKYFESISFGTFIIRAWGEKITLLCYRKILFGMPHLSGFIIEIFRSVCVSQKNKNYCYYTNTIKTEV